MKDIANLSVKLSFLGLVLLFSVALQALTNHEFSEWWSSYRLQPNIPKELKEMEDYFIQSGSLIYSSNFWNDYNKKNIEQLTELGINNFKQTVATNYFTWTVSIEHPYAKRLKQLVHTPTLVFDRAEISRKHSLFDQQKSLNYNIVTMYFLNYMLNNGWGSYIDLLEEPLFGNPPFNIYNGKRVSQDIFNSLLEYLSIVPNCPMDQISTIIEIGAGSGRTAFCFLSLNPDKKYIIVDFPPALYVSQTYLSEVFKDRKILSFRSFENFNEIAKEFSEANIVFLTPDQLQKIPNNSSGLFLAIDCLHEMKPERIAYYFNEAERLSSYIYYKCWQSTYVAQDNVSYSQNSYPVHVNWQKIFNEPCSIPSDFFHAFYRIK